MDRFSILVGDLTASDAEAIVNAANPTLLGGSGVDGAIHAAAGPELLAECRTLHGCETGQAKLTGGYRLKARYVIHTVGPIIPDGQPTSEQEEQLASCYRSCLDIAEDYSLHSIALCCISTGVFNFPRRRAAEIAVDTVRSYPKKNIDTVIFNTFKDEDDHVYRQLVQ